METVNGEWIMKGCRRNDPKRLHSPEDLLMLIRKIGFLPLFSNDITGFSVEEHTTADHWWTDDPEDPWAWRQVLAREDGVVYGKFFDKKAGFVSKEWFPDFANFRRQGYDFDARYDDGLASFYDKELFEMMDLKAPALSKELKKDGGYGKNGKKGFDTIITRLQKQCYVITSDFCYSTDKYGNKYGWGIAEYSTPEKFLGKKFMNSVYKRTPEESYVSVLKQLKKILPNAEQKQIEKILR
jgi:hypothetical protein